MCMCIGEGNGNPLQYFLPGKSMDRGVCQATVHGVTKSQMQLVTQQEQQMCVCVCVQTHLTSSFIAII